MCRNAGIGVCGNITSYCSFDTEIKRKKGVVSLAYEDSQTFKETENDSHIGMEEAEVCVQALVR